MNFDDNLSLDQLENDYGGEPEFNSGLVKSCHRLRRIPVNKLTAGDLRLLIEQGIGLQYLVPVSFRFLADYPLVQGALFNGDLLKSILMIPKEFWDNNQSLFFGLSEIMTAVESLYSTIGNDIYPIWDGLFSKTVSFSDSTSDKEKLIRKNGLRLENGAWYSHKENSHKHLVFRESFVQRQDVIGLLFRINKLCMAKVKYFRQNIDSYEPCKYDFRKGFVNTELWDSDFLRHKASGIILDYRFLQSITVYSEFVKLCDELENYKKNS